MTTTRIPGSLLAVTTLALIALLVVWGARSAGAGAPSSGTAICNAALERLQFDAGTTLFDARVSTAGAIADWQRTRHSPEIVLDTPPMGAFDRDETAYVCTYKGTFVTPVGPPGADGKPNPQHNLIRYIVLADGTAIIDSAGYIGSLDKEIPPGSP